LPLPLVFLALTHSVNTPDFLSPVSFIVTFDHSPLSYQSPNLNNPSHSVSVCNVISSHFLPFVFPYLIFYFSCNTLLVPHFLLSASFYICLSYFLDRLILRLSPIFIVNSFLYLLPLSLVYLYLRLLHDNSSINKRPFVKSTCSWNTKRLSQLMRQ
jgi:hypothetical protein